MVQEVFIATMTSTIQHGALDTGIHFGQTLTEDDLWLQFDADLRQIQQQTPDSRQSIEYSRINSVSRNARSFRASTKAFGLAM